MVALCFPRFPCSTELPHILFLFLIIQHSEYLHNFLAVCHEALPARISILFSNQMFYFVVFQHSTNQL
jgi:hypothetical protein